LAPVKSQVGLEAPPVHWIDALVEAVRVLATEGSRAGLNWIRLGGVR
jgi:hypothetical protein